MPIDPPDNDRDPFPREKRAQLFSAVKTMGKGFQSRMISEKTSSNGRYEPSDAKLRMLNGEMSDRSKALKKSVVF